MAHELPNGKCQLLALFQMCKLSEKEEKGVFVPVKLVVSTVLYGSS